MKWIFSVIIREREGDGVRIEGQRNDSKGYCCHGV